MQKVINENILDFIKWLKDNPSTQYLIENNGMDLKGKDLLNIMNVLEKGGFYEIIYTITMSASGNIEISRAIEKFIYQAVIEIWESKGTETMYNIFKDILIEEINDRENNL